MKLIKTRSVTSAEVLLLPVAKVDTLANIPGGESNLLPSSGWQTDLRVEFEQWGNSNPSPEFPEELTLYWDDQPLETKKWTGPIDPAELFITVPQSRLSEGEHLLTYTVLLSNQLTDTSGPLTITIDKTAPLLPAGVSLVFPSEVIDEGVTDAYLIREIDVVAQVDPVYSSPKPGDVIRLFWSTSPVAEELIGEITLTLADMSASLPQLVFEGQMIRDHGDGMRYAHYRVLDRAGNLSPPSARVELNVAATPIPRQLPYPKVLQASGSGSTSSLNPLSAPDGVTIQIPEAAVIHTGEKVKVLWGEASSSGYFEGEWVDVPDTRQFDVSKAFMPQHMGHSIPVKYNVKPVAGDDALSEALTVNMSMVPGSGMEYGQCAVSQVSVSNFPAEGLVVTLNTSWFWILPGQHVRIRAVGVAAQSRAAEFRVLAITEVTEEHIKAGSITALITQADLAAFKVPSELTLITNYSFDGEQTWMTDEESPKFMLNLVK